MLAGEVYPTSMTRRPGSAWSRLRNAAHPPEWRGILGPVRPGAVAGESLSCFLSNQRLNNLKPSRGRADDSRAKRPDESC